MVDAVRDLGSYLSRVYIGKKPSGTRKNIEPLYIDQFWAHDDGSTMVRFYNRETDKFKDVKWNEDDYLLDCPQVGMVSDGEKVYYISRSPQRQWKRGYTPNVLHLELLSKYEAREMSLAPKPLFDKAIVSFAYNPEYTSLSDGLESMKRGKMFSFPLSRKFAVGQKANSLHPVVYYKSWIIGWVEDDTIILPKNTSHLYEELSQYAKCRRA